MQIKPDDYPPHRMEPDALGAALPWYAKKLLALADAQAMPALGREPGPDADPTLGWALRNYEAFNGVCKGIILPPRHALAPLAIRIDAEAVVVRIDPMPESVGFAVLRTVHPVRRLSLNVSWTLGQGEEAQDPDHHRAAKARRSRRQAQKRKHSGRKGWPRGLNARGRKAEEAEYHNMRARHDLAWLRACLAEVDA